MDKIEVLFWEHGKTKRHKLGNYHFHNYWQLELIISGAPLLEIKNEQGLKLEAGDLAIVPSGNRHRFNFFEKAKESWSFKYNFIITKKNLSPVLIRNDAEAETVKDSLIKLATTNEDLTESLLAAAMIQSITEKYYPSKISVKNKNQELADKIRKLILKSGSGKVDVPYLAREIGYSRDYLSSLFKKTTGISLKQFIDNERLKIAKRFLLYSDYSISDIADKMGFTDQFAFSHFFKRLEGEYPKFFRLTEKFPQKKKRL